MAVIRVFFIIFSLFVVLNAQERLICDKNLKNCVSVKKNKYEKMEHYNLFVKYSKKYNIPIEILLAIAEVESNFNVKAENLNSNNSVDIGIMQVNTIHLNELKRFKLKLYDLYRPEININFATHVLQRCMRTNNNGFSWKALNCYNGRTIDNQYSQKVMRKALEIQQIFSR